MAFWEKHMPQGMFLRSGAHASSLGDPDNRLSLERYRALHGLPSSKPVPIDHFVSYGHWFQKQVVPDVDRRSVTHLAAASHGFRLTLENGEEIRARRVVIATGISPFSHRPAQYADLPPALVSHSFDHADLSRLAGQRVAVVGAGQSALESAALLHEAGTEVEIIARAPGTYMIPGVTRSGVILSIRRLLSHLVRPPFDIMGPRMLSWLIAVPRVYRRVPRALQDSLTARAVRPAGAAWLVPRLTSVRVTTGRAVTAATPRGSQLRLRLSDGTERVVDHLLLATGYRVDVTRYPFLAPALRETIRTRDGYPELDVGFESSVPGLHFLGTPAAGTFGPLCRFVVGSKYAARELTRVIASRNGHRNGHHAIQPVLSEPLSA